MHSERQAGERGAAQELAAQALEVERRQREEDERRGGIEHRAAEQQREPRLQRAAQRPAVAHRRIAEGGEVRAQHARELVEQRRVVVARAAGRRRRHSASHSAADARRVRPTPRRAARAASPAGAAPKPAASRSHRSR